MTRILLHWLKASVCDQPVTILVDRPMRQRLIERARAKGMTLEKYAETATVGWWARYWTDPEAALAELGLEDGGRRTEDGRGAGRGCTGAMGMVAFIPASPLRSSSRSPHGARRSRG